MAGSNNWVLVDATSLGYPGEQRFYNKSTGEYSYGNPTGPLGGYLNPAGPASDRRALGYFIKDITQGVSDHFNPNSAKYQTQTKDGSTSPRTSSLNPYAAGPDGKPSDYLDPVKKSDTSTSIPTSTPRSTSRSTSTRRPLRDPEPLAPTFAAAVESLGPGAFGDMTWGRVIGRPNPTGFTELTPEMQQEIASVWSKDMMPPINVAPYDKSIFEGTPVAFSSSEGLPAGVGFNDVDLNSGLYDTVLSQSQPMTGLQALRADERSKGLIYASGKYWADNADGKLEAIPTDLVNGEGTARQQAIAFMESRKQPIIEAVQKNSKVNESVMTPTSESPSPQLKGFTGVSGTRPDGTAKTAQEIDNEIELRQQALEEQSIIKAPTQTTPFGDISEGFQSTQLPGNTDPGLITVGPNKGLYINPENIENGYEKYDENRYYLKGNVDGNELGLW